MAHLMKLNAVCSDHMFPFRMSFAHWSGPYRATYQCPACTRKRTYRRKHRFGPVVQVR